jgi:hypothetical protein
MDVPPVRRSDAGVERGGQGGDVQPLRIDVQRREQAVLGPRTFDPIAQEDDAADSCGGDEREQYESTPGACQRTHSHEVHRRPWHSSRPPEG